MNRVTTTTIAAASLLLGAICAPAAFAQTSGTGTTTSTSSASQEGTSMRHDGHRGHGGHRGMQGMRNATPEERAVVRSIMRLERIYLTQGRVNDIKPLLDNVKRKTSNATVIAFVDRQLERIANRPTNPDQRIATLTQKLSDDIAKLQ
ncbi:MAG: hypothetical protein ABIP56_04215 [Dokdonella sp.]